MCETLLFIKKCKKIKAYEDTVSAIVEVSVLQATYFDLPQIGVKTAFLKQNHQFLYQT